MMDGMSVTGQEEYIWAMRMILYRESDSDLWKQRRLEEISGASDLAKSATSIVNIEHLKTKVCASLVPDEVINNVGNYEHRRYDACFLFGDVSGFTELCEKYSKLGVAGPSKMTQVLNKFIGSMVQEVLSHNGDVLKFSGDAFLAMYKSNDDITMRDAVHLALDTALVIQKSYGSFVTDMGVIIRVKLAISAGLVTFALIGEETMSHYVVVGKPIWDVKAAEHISVAGDIIVHPAAWHYVNANEYIYTEMDDKIHIKVLGIGPFWRSAQKGGRQQKQEKIKQESKESISSENSSTDYEGDIFGQEIANNDEFALRPAVNLAVRKNLRESLRKFIIAPVMKSIDENEPLEFMTEMRQAVICFINIVTTGLQTQQTVILADLSYRIVCRNVNKMKGCVNKVSLFDKDLMFVVIFGLRGLKHELECQIALRCARQCHNEISKLPGVQSTSIGITTGKTYCGVFGHTLRREYTVISLIVNKAARLMVNYKNKITCDRDTFLHSKLESRHFILQEYKPLKGISHPGPVYEFRECELSHDDTYKVDPRPLLGREDFLQVYEELLEKCIVGKDADYRMMLIKGYARQGKSRLLDELLYITPLRTPINRIILNRTDVKIPFQTMRLIFFPSMNLTVGSTTEQKEQTLSQILRTLPVPDLMCLMNDVFAVNYKKTQIYHELSDDGRYLALKEIIKHLCHKCFRKLWVIAIDNSDYMDEESWVLLPILLDYNNIFIASTISLERIKSCHRFKGILDDPRVYYCTIGAIPRWYLGALCCQILNVYAISPELENVIQNKSNGNPGWIESFLISLIQDKELLISKASLKECNDMGLVCPPFYLMARLTKHDTCRWQYILEERNYSHESIKGGSWKKYIDSCRDSYLNISVRERMEDISKSGKVRICITAPTFAAGDEEEELSMDAVIIKTFDSLNFFEQILVKCGAILGNAFLREMMVYVMNATEKRQVALAVKKLFEVKVLSCAKGDFLDGGTVFKERLLNPDDEQELRCKCRGVKAEDGCTDLPSYASCGYMQFRNSTFREITYNLLTHNQKSEFHDRAIRYLERETRRCKACGGGYFDRLLGARQDKEFLAIRDREKQVEIGFGDGSVDDTGSVSMGRRSSQQSTGTTNSGHSTGRRRYDDKSSVSFAYASGDRRSSFVKPSAFKFSGIKSLHKLKDSFSLTRAFSSDDFTDCQCNLILSTAYAQLVEHCLGADDLTRAVDAMHAYARNSILLNNMPLALKTLQKALEVLDKIEATKKEVQWKTSYTRAKIYILLGRARLELTQYNSALKNLYKAMEAFDIKLPTGLRRSLKTLRKNFQQWYGLYFAPVSMLKHYDHWQTVYNNSVSECLSCMCRIFIHKKEWANAELTATWSLIKSLESFCNFQTICTAFENMLFICQRLQKWKMCTALELHGLKLCHIKKINLTAEDLFCVAKFYSMIFHIKWQRSTVAKIIHMGFIVIRLSTSIKVTQTVLPIIPLLVQALLMAKHFTEVNTVIQELEYFCNEETDASGRIWYLSLCVMVQLETGYTIIPYQACESFYLIEGESWSTVQHPDARRRFFTVMWLWCIRNEKWEEASVWCLKTDDFSYITEGDSLANKITALYLLEGLLIFLGWKLDRRNIKAVVQAEHEIKELFHILNKAAKKWPLLMPRLQHLKAYCKHIHGNDAAVLNMLLKGQELAVKKGNELENSWINHTINAWSRNLTPIMVDFWREHTSDGDNLLDFHEIELTEKVGYFTLPTPAYNV